MSEWISVKDRLPDGTYLAIFYVDEDGEPYYEIGGGMPDKYYKDMFTHWMPLPDPPDRNIKE